MMLAKCPKCNSNKIELQILSKIKDSELYNAEACCMACGAKSGKMKVKPDQGISKGMGEDFVFMA